MVRGQESKGARATGFATPITRPPAVDQMQLPPFRTRRSPGKAGEGATLGFHVGGIDSRASEHR